MNASINFETLTCIVYLLSHKTEQYHGATGLYSPQYGFGRPRQYWEPLWGVLSGGDIHTIGLFFLLLEKLHLKLQRHLLLS